MYHSETSDDTVKYETDEIIYTHEAHKARRLRTSLLKFNSSKNYKNYKEMHKRHFIAMDAANGKKMLNWFFLKNTI